MYVHGATATTVKITAISQRPRLLSVSSIESRGGLSPSSPPAAPCGFTQDTHSSGEDSPEDTIPSPKGIKLPHTRYIPIRSHSSTAVTPEQLVRPSLARAPHSTTVVSPPFSAPRPLQAPRPSLDDPWALPLANYSFHSSYDASGSASSDSRSVSSHSRLSKSSSRSSSGAVNQKTKAWARSESDVEHLGGWFKRLWRR